MKREPNLPFANHPVPQDLTQVMAPLLQRLDRIEAALRMAAANEPVFRSDDAILTVEGAATMAGCSPKTIRKWIHSGRLRAGDRPYRIRRADLIAALARKKDSGAPQAPGTLDQAWIEKQVRKLTGS